jgi:hypothetical protein
VVGLFDRANNLIDRDGQPFDDGTARVRALIGTTTD